MGPTTTRRVRRLTTTEIGRYDLLDEPLAARVRIIRLPRPPGPYVGLTIGRFVFLASEADPSQPSTLLAHELVHVRQWHELGPVGFLWRYLADFTSGVRTHRSWKQAYQGIRAEQEAHSEAAAWTARSGEA